MIAYLIIFIVLVIDYNKQKNKEMKGLSVGVRDYDEKRYNKLDKPLSLYV